MGMTDDWERMIAQQQAAARQSSSEMEMLVRMRDMANGEAPSTEILRRGRSSSTVAVGAGQSPVEAINWYTEDSCGVGPWTITIVPQGDTLGNLAFNTQTALAASLAFTSPSGTSQGQGIGQFPIANIDSAPTGSVPATVNGPQNRLFANIKWGSISGTARASIDVGKGVQFSVSGGLVAVDIGCDAGSTAGQMQVAAWLSPGSCYRYGPMTRTIYIDSLPAAIAPAEQQNYVVPAMARALLPTLRTPLSKSYQITFYDSRGNAIWRLSGGGSDTVFPSSSTALPADTYSFGIENTSNAILNVRIPFELAF